ncbi:uncharacterized protein LOC142350544 [Convolutriloba macropyga]|uniref:uncharacterized protein LOC142350544 n=1 Tax=Convolutriloba macropyga TaxID=536237 RepID=UPI003F526F43
MLSNHLVFIILNVITLISLKAPLCDCSTGGISGSGSGTRTRESLDFLLPDPKDDQGLKCFQYSLYFCLMRYWTGTGRDRTVSRNSLVNYNSTKFSEMIAPYFRYMNWFSFQEEDKRNGGCCRYQTSVYIEHGLQRGMTAGEYFDKITDFTDEGKSLVYIKLRYDSECCHNVITQIGFGKGSLKIVGGKKGKDYIFPPLGREDLHVFSWKVVSRIISFDWFKDQVICKEREWVCAADGEKTASSNENRRGKRVSVIETIIPVVRSKQP